MGIGVIQLIMLLIIPITLGLTLWGAFRVVQRAGYSGGWAFILLVPLVNLVMLYVFAFADWPALQRARSGPPGPGSGTS